MKYRYKQIASKMAKKIEYGEWLIGQRLTGEIALAKEYEVGRSTIREALSLLEEQGLIEKRNGIGTFVKSQKRSIQNPLLKLESVGAMIQRSGYEVGSIHHSTFHEEPSSILMKKMGLTPVEKVVVVNRERTADGKTVAMAYHVFPENLVGEMFDEGITGSILDIIERIGGIQITHTLSEIKGIDGNKPWDKEAVELLQGPIVLLEQLHFNAMNEPIFFSFDYINTDLVTLNLRRERE